MDAGGGCVFGGSFSKLKVKKLMRPGQRARRLTQETLSAPTPPLLHKKAKRFFDEVASQCYYDYSVCGTVVLHCCCLQCGEFFTAGSTTSEFSDSLLQTCYLLTNLHFFNKMVGKKGVFFLFFRSYKKECKYIHLQ